MALHLSFLGGMILILLIVLVGSMMVGQVGGLDVKQYFGLNPILGDESEISTTDAAYAGSVKGSVITGCGKFKQWLWGTGSPESGVTLTFAGFTLKEFRSTACPTGQIPVSCAMTLEEGYGAASMYIDEDTGQCVVQSAAETGQVGVLCASLVEGDDEDITYVWDTAFEGTDGTVEGIDGGNSGYGAITTIGSGLSCPTGYGKFFGMVQTDTSSGMYAEDTISFIRSDLAIIFDPSVTLDVGSTYHPYVNNDIQKKFGIVCMKRSVVTECGISEPTITCPGDSQVVSCMGGMHYEYEGTAITIDPVMYAIYPTGNMLVTAWVGDTSGNQFFNSRLNIMTTSTFNENQLDSSGDTGMQNCTMGTGTASYESYAVCARKLWHWSFFEEPTVETNYPLFEKDCPDGYKAIACASDSASLEDGYESNGQCGVIGFGDNVGGGLYGEDAINSIYFNADNSGCLIRATDKNGDDEHKRRSGVLCVNSDTFTNDFHYVPGSSFQSSTTEYQLFSSEQCPDEMMPIFCTVEMQYESGGGHYDEDMISQTYVDKTNRKCTVMLIDLMNSVQFSAKIGAMCAKTANVQVKIEDAVYGTVTKFVNPFFTSKSCASGVATTAITKVDDTLTKYKEDFIVSMMPNSPIDPTTGASSTWGGFVVQASDTVGCGEDRKEHYREVGVVCLTGYSNTVFGAVQSTTGSYSGTCTGTTPSACSNFASMEGSYGCQTLQKGCTDPTGGTGTCTGLPTPCVQRTNSLQCEGIQGMPTGCTWS
jgi:hypothetical protein